MKFSISVIATTALFALLLSHTTAPAQDTASGNLVRNFSLSDAKNARIEFRSTAEPKHMRMNLFTEDRTWNKCLSLKLDSFDVDKTGQRKVNGGIIIGGERIGKKSMFGFKAKPDTLYSFSLELKGTAPSAWINALYWDGPDYYKDRKKIDSSINGEVKLNKDWTRYTGTFKTPAKLERAALYVQMWGEDKFGMKYKEGDYLLLDNVKIEEKKIQVMPGAANTTVAEVPLKKTTIALLTDAGITLDGTLDDPVWGNAGSCSDFIDYKSTKPAKAQTSVKIFADNDAFYLGIVCLVPAPDSIKDEQSGLGQTTIWQDDVVEIFFGPVSRDRKLSQFVVSAGGARWMGHGEKAITDAEQYDKWQAVVKRAQSGWTIEAKIPFALLGFETAPVSGDSLPFEVCRQRPASKELSAWTFVNGRFHNIKKYGLLILGEFPAWVEAKRKEFGAKLERHPDSDRRKELLKAVATLNGSASTTEAFAKIVQKADTIEQQIKMLELQHRKYVFGPVSPTADMSIPALPESLFNPAKRIDVSAAVNEFKCVPIGIYNLTDKTAAYRIFPYANLNDGIEVFGLQGFPSKNIEVREAVRVKDSDAVTHGLMFDALPKMNEAFTVTIPPHETGFVWMMFNCSNVEPGTYRGAVRIIPLSEPGKVITDGEWRFDGEMQDMPLTLEILDITLPRKPPIPLWYMRDARSESFFKSMVEHDADWFQMSPYSFGVQFDDEGEAVSTDTEAVEKNIRQHLLWAKKYDLNIHFLLAFSAYEVFERVHAKNKFEIGSPAWKRAWPTWLRTVEKTFEKCGVDPSEVIVELFDEPGEKSAPLIEQVAKTAKDAGIKLNTSLTIASTRPPRSDLESLIPVIDEWCIWGAHFKNDDMLKLVDAVKRSGKRLSVYMCYTRMSEELYGYYRLHAWLGKLYECESIGMFVLFDGPNGYYGRRAWKCASEGGMVYNSMYECIPSIRYEALRIGLTDIKYLHVLENAVRLAKANGRNDEAVKHAEKLLAELPTQVIDNAYDNTRADAAREQVVKLILALRK